MKSTDITMHTKSGGNVQDVQILYHAHDILVLRKPCNIPMDGTDDDITIEKWILHSGLLHSSMGSPKRIKWVHQLDKPTSGILCVALSRDAATILSHCFQARSIYKEYTAIILGHLPFSIASQSTAQSCHKLDTRIDRYCGPPLRLPLVIAMPVGFDERDENDFKMRILGKGRNQKAKEASTEILSCDTGYILRDHICTKGPTVSCAWWESREVLDQQTSECKYYPNKKTDVSTAKYIPVTRVVIRLHSGRRHQIRVHMAQVLRQPILNDMLYGGTLNNTSVVRASDSDENTPQLYLHASKLFFPIQIDDSGSFSEPAGTKGSDSFDEGYEKRCGKNSIDG